MSGRDERPTGLSAEQEDALEHVWHDAVVRGVSAIFCGSKRFRAVVM